MDWQSDQDSSRPKSEQIPQTENYIPVSYVLKLILFLQFWFKQKSYKHLAPQHISPVRCLDNLTVD